MDTIELTLTDDAKATRVRQYLSKLHLSDDVARRIKEVFIKELDSGMRGGLEASSLQMENTFVGETTTRGICGKFLAMVAKSSLRLPVSNDWMISELMW